MLLMVNMTLALPDELHRILEKHREIKWSEIARQAIWLQARKVELMDKILKKSKLTEEDAEVIGNKIKREIAKRHGLVK